MNNMSESHGRPALNNVLQNWEPDMIRFMRDACEYGSYNAHLAALIGASLPADAHVCDAGCGLGYLSIALSPYAKHVTAADINADALRVLEENRAARGLANITPRCVDLISDVPPQRYDAMVFCFFGTMPSILSVARRQCQEDIFVILRNYDSHRFSVGRHGLKSGVYSDACRLLTEMGVPYTGKTLSLEFGQPFASLEDARLFFRLYSKDADASLLTDAFVQSKLQHTDDMKMPYYMPHTKKLGVIHIHCRDLPAAELSV